MLPEGWKLSCLGKVCAGRLQTGPFGSQLHAHEYADQGVAVLMPKDLIGYYANTKNAVKISIDKFKEIKRHQLVAGDILFSRRGEVSRLALIDTVAEGAVCGTGCLRARPSSMVYPGFLFFFLQLPTIKSWLEHNAVGQTMLNMNTEILYELPLVLPPLPEQKKIAAILSTWDRAIEGTEKLLANSQQQKKALMQQLLTAKKRLPGFVGEWERVKISDIANIRTSVSKAKYFSKDGERFIVDMGSVDRQGKLKCTKKTHHDGDVLEKGTLIMPKDDIGGGNIIGKTAIIAHNNLYVMSDHVYALHIHDCYSGFIHFLINSYEINKSLLRKANGTAQLGLGRKEVLKQKIRIPPSLPEQKAIAAVLTTADDEITAIRADLERLRREKKALMQQLLTGKRRVVVDAEVSA